MVKCNVPIGHQETNLKDRFSQVDANDFYRVHDGVPQKKNTLYNFGRTCAVAGAFITLVHPGRLENCYSFMSGLESRPLLHR